MPIAPRALLVSCAIAVLPGAAIVSADPALVILVRHAERAAAPADDPPLTPAGEGRAQALAEVLADTRIDAIVSTPYRRTRATAAPTAAGRHIDPVIVDASGDTAADVAAVAAAVRARPAGEAVLVVGHSNTVPAIIGALGGPTLPALCNTEYANLFVLVLGPGTPRLIRSHYGTPDPPAAADCNRVMKQERR
jgi:broad specificity phosphatase PhoE